MITHCFSSLCVQKDQNKTVGELLVQDRLEKDDRCVYVLQNHLKKLAYKVG